MDGRMNIFIVEFSKRNCFTGTFKAKPGVTITDTYLLKIKKNKKEKKSKQL